MLITTSGLHSRSTMLLTLVITPVIIFILSIFGQSKLEGFDKVYVNKTIYVNAILNEDILSRVTIASTMLLYAPSTKFAVEIVRKTQLKLNIYNEMLKPFPTKEELIQYYNKFEHEDPTVVIIFNNIRHTIPDHLDYDIKIYEDRVDWDTDKLFSNPFLYIPGTGAYPYLNNAFAAVQVAVDTSFIEMVTGKPLNTSLTYQEFPYPPHLDTDDVTIRFPYILPLITIIAFIFNPFITLKRILPEKSLGLKKHLKIDRVKSRTIWLGWLLIGILVNLVSVILVAIVLTKPMFRSKYAVIEHCNVAILAIFISLYCFATITLFFAFMTFFRRATLAMVLGVSLWITSYFIFVEIGENIKVMSIGIILSILFPPFGLYLGYNTISSFEILGKDITFCNVFKSPTESSDNVPLGFVIVMLLFDTVFYFVLTLCLDKIWPGECGIAKRWYFLIQKIRNRKTDTNTMNTVSGERELLSAEESRVDVQLRCYRNKRQHHKEKAPKRLKRSNTSFITSRKLPTILKYRRFLKERLSFFSKNKLEYLLTLLIAFGIVLLTLWLSNTAFADVSRNDTKIPLELSLYGNTEVDYSIAGTDHQTEIDKYFKNIVSSSNSTATKVENVPETIVAKGTENIVHYTKKMIIAAEFTSVDNGSSVHAVNIMYANKAYHGASISINVVMNTLLKYYAGDEFSISTSNAPLHARTKKEEPLPQSEFSNVCLWIVLLPISSLLIASTALLLRTDRTKSTKTRCDIGSCEYWILCFLFHALYTVVVISIILPPLYFIPFHFMDVSVMVQFWLLHLVHGIAYIPFLYFFMPADTVETGYAGFLITHIVFPPIVVGLLLVMEKENIFLDVIDVLKSLCFIGDPHVSLCFYLAKFSIKMILNHNWEIMPANDRKGLCLENHLNDPCCSEYFYRCKNVQH
ncbi:hypothetical protein Trydic_g10593 [Trypoxylus dichotomus]